MGIKLRQFLQGISRKIYVLVERMGERERFLPRCAMKRNFRASSGTMLVAGAEIEFVLCARERLARGARDLSVVRGGEQGRHASLSLSLDFNFDLCDGRRNISPVISRPDARVTDRDERQFSQTYIGKSRFVIAGVARGCSRINTSEKTVSLDLVFVFLLELDLFESKITQFSIKYH